MGGSKDEGTNPISSVKPLNAPISLVWGWVEYFIDRGINEALRGKRSRYTRNLDGRRGCVYVLCLCVYVCVHEHVIYDIHKHRGGGIHKNMKPTSMKRLTNAERCGIILLDSERVARRQEYAVDRMQRLHRGQGGDIHHCVQ